MKNRILCKYSIPGTPIPLAKLENGNYYWLYPHRMGPFYDDTFVFFNGWPLSSSGNKSLKGLKDLKPFWVAEGYRAHQSETLECECGCDSTGGGSLHSDWCPKAGALL